MIDDSGVKGGITHEGNHEAVEIEGARIEGEANMSNGGVDIDGGRG